MSKGKEFEKYDKKEGEDFPYNVDVSKMERESSYLFWVGLEEEERDKKKKDQWTREENKEIREK